MQVGPALRCRTDCNLDNLIYLRGSGCGDTPDTNTVADWHEQWSRLGGSTFCFDTNVAESGTITPLLAPNTVWQTFLLGLTAPRTRCTFTCTCSMRSTSWKP